MAMENTSCGECMFAVGVRLKMRGWGRKRESAGVYVCVRAPTTAVCRVAISSKYFLLLLLLLQARASAGQAGYSDARLLPTARPFSPSKGVCAGVWTTGEGRGANGRQPAWPIPPA